MTVYRTGRGTSIRLTARLGSGGEANVFSVDGRPEEVAKIYHGSTPAREQKLAVMVAAPPLDPTLSSGHASIAWPSDTLLDATGRVRGFIMPRLDRHSYPLASLYNPATRRRRLPGFTWKYLIRTCRNLASALESIHDKDYVVGDLNESNVWVMPTAMVTFIDCDSMQVRVDEGGRSVVHRNTVGKAEYTAPELQTVSFGDVDRTIESDSFAFAVLAFMCLMQGYHPYARVWRGSGPAPMIGELIRTGRYAYSGEASAAPPPHAPSINILPTELVRLFHRAFVTGHRVPSRRPRPGEWMEALSRLEAALVSCYANPQHVYSGHLTICPWCERMVAGIPDPFPGPSGLRRGQLPLLPVRRPQLRTPGRQSPAKPPALVPPPTSTWSDQRILTTVTAAVAILAIFVAGAVVGSDLLSGVLGAVPQASAIAAPLVTTPPPNPAIAATPTSRATTPTASAGPTPIDSLTPGRTVSPAPSADIVRPPPGSEPQATTPPATTSATLRDYLPASCSASIERFDGDIDFDGVADRVITGQCDEEYWYGPIARVSSVDGVVLVGPGFFGFPMAYVPMGVNAIDEVVFGVVTGLGASGASTAIEVFEVRSEERIASLKVVGLSELGWEDAIVSAKPGPTAGAARLTVQYEDFGTATCRSCNDGDHYEDTYQLDLQGGSGYAVLESHELLAQSQNSDNGTAYEDYLRLHVPFRTEECASIVSPAPTGALAGLRCKFSGTPLSRAEVNYYAFPDLESMNAWFAGRLQEFGALAPGDCYSGHAGYQAWFSGQLGCYSDGDWSNARWTHEELLIYAGGTWRDVPLQDLMAYWSGLGPY